MPFIGCRATSLAARLHRRYHQESFADLYLDALGGKVGFPSIDWTMGPLCLRASLAHHWTSFDGELWGARVHTHTPCGKED